MSRLGTPLSMEIAELAILAKSKGWATCRGSFESLRIKAQLAHWREAPIRKGESAVVDLRPIEPADAQPRSLSALYGTGDQPLHTDGAHMRVPPDVVVLFGEAPSRTPTLISRGMRHIISKIFQFPPEGATDGIFLVDGGSDKFLAHAYEVARGWRYDPGCMTPSDQRARDVRDYIENIRSSAYVHEWAAPETILMIDNRKCLHARSAVREGDDGRVLKRLAFHTDVKP